MAKTRQPMQPQVHLSALGDRPRVFVNVGYRAFSWWFDDCEELAGYLVDAVRNDGLSPTYAAFVLHYCKEQFGHYDDERGHKLEAPAGNGTQLPADVGQTDKGRPPAARLVGWVRRIFRGVR